MKETAKDRERERIRHLESALTRLRDQKSGLETAIRNLEREIKAATNALYPEYADI